VVSGFSQANRRKARKLGLLRAQKFRSRARENGAAGADDRVCGECPTLMLILIEYSGLTNQQLNNS